MKITNHKLDGVVYQSSPNTSGLFLQGNLDTIVIHYTAGSSAESSIRSLVTPSSKASAHVVVGRDGLVTQLVPFDTIAWHAGASQYGNRSGFNKYSIGIEIDNAGLLEKRVDKYYAWFGRAYSEQDVVYAVHRNQKTPRYWHVYSEKQIEAVGELCEALIATYNIRYILGHEEISPSRKVDPGPAFPLDKLRERIFGGSRNQDTPESNAGKIGSVTTNLLNIRTDADVNADKVAKPLMRGQKVKIVESKNGWLKVTTEVTGWVSAKFVE